ncbi:hypothetical protein [Streptomyces venetus]
MPFGAAVFAGDYVTLPIAGLDKPIWQYDNMGQQVALEMVQ